MNGSYGANAHTVSPKQVIKLMESVYQLACKFKTNVENVGNDFIVKLSKQWEDENAITFARDFKRLMEIVAFRLCDVTSGFNVNVCSIANGYVAAGGRNKEISPEKVSFGLAIDISPVKSAFEDGDTFGMKDSNSISRIDSDFKDLVKSCEKYITELHDEVLRINAYGNEGVRMSLANQAANLFVECKKALDEVQFHTVQVLKDAAISYNKVTSSFTGGNNSSYSSSSNNSGSIQGSFLSGGNNAVGEGVDIPKDEMHHSFTPKESPAFEKHSSEKAVVEGHSDYVDSFPESHVNSQRGLLSPREITSFNSSVTNVQSAIGSTEKAPSGFTGTSRAE